MQSGKWGNYGCICNALRVLSKTCDFGEGIDERIRDQVVQGLFSNEQKFPKTENLTLNSILKKAKVVVISKGQIRQMKGEKQEHVCMVQYRKNIFLAQAKARKSFKNIQDLIKVV